MGAKDRAPDLGERQIASARSKATRALRTRGLGGSKGNASERSEASQPALAVPIWQRVPPRSRRLRAPLGRKPTRRLRSARSSPSRLSLAGPQPAPFWPGAFGASRAIERSLLARATCVTPQLNMGPCPPSQPSLALKHNFLADHNQRAPSDAPICDVALPDATGPAWAQM